jgi:hypothetical protein
VACNTAERIGAEADARSKTSGAPQSKESGIVSTAQPSMLAAQKKGASEETPIHTK